MKGIFYFSSTGNSLYIAKKIQQTMGGDVIYIPTYLGDGSEYEHIFIVSPIYSFGLPVHVYDLIPKLAGVKDVNIILNYGGMVGGADYFTYQHCVNNKINVNSIYTVKMPENFTLSFTVPKLYMKMTLKLAPKRIEKIISQLKVGTKALPKPKKTKGSTYFKNKSSWHEVGEAFGVSNECTKCQKCIGLCPVKNISMSNGKISFSNKCVACLGCYHRCPQQAIRYKNKNKKFRYINPNINELYIGKNS